MGHFGDVLPSQSRGLVLKKLNPNTTKANNTRTKRQNIHKANLDLNQQSTVRTAPMCVHTCALSHYATQHRTVLTTFRLILQTIIIAQMLFTAGERVIMHKIQTSGQSFDIRPDRCRTRTVQSYSPGGANVPIYTVSKKRPTRDLLQSWHTPFANDNIWHKCYWESWQSNVLIFPSHLTSASAPPGK